MIDFDAERRRGPDAAIDIINRLRLVAQEDDDPALAILREAADEIERLRKALVERLTPPVHPAPYIPTTPYWPYYPAPGDIPPAPISTGCQCPPGANLTCQAPLCPRKPLRSAIGTGTIPL